MNFGNLIKTKPKKVSEIFFDQHHCIDKTNVCVKSKITVTCHLSPLTSHLSPVTCHLSHILKKKSIFFIKKKKINK